jgi:hypothetical protein
VVHHRGSASHCLSSPGTSPYSHYEQAKSPLRLRLVFAGFGVIACGLAALMFVELAGQHEDASRTVLGVLAGAAFVGAVVAAVDALLLIRRRRGGDRA